MTGRVAVTSFLLDAHTSFGLARVHCDVPGHGRGGDGAVGPCGGSRAGAAEGGTVRGRLLLGHGAGGGVEAKDLKVARDVAVAAGWAVGRVEQPWRVAGKRVAPAPPRLDVAWLEVVAGLLGSDGGRSAFAAGAPLVLGGRSAGARVACRTSGELRADGVLCLAFPLHPPGRPERSRVAELAGVTCPVLVVQGERDPFGRPEEVRASAPGGARVVAVRGDHSSCQDAGAVGEAVRSFLDALLEA